MHKISGPRLKLSIFDQCMLRPTTLFYRKLAQILASMLTNSKMWRNDI